MNKATALAVILHDRLGHDMREIDLHSYLTYNLDEIDFEELQNAISQSYFDEFRAWVSTIVNGGNFVMGGVGDMIDDKLRGQLVEWWKTNADKLNLTKGGLKGPPVC